MASHRLRAASTFRCRFAASVVTRWGYALTDNGRRPGRANGNPSFKACFRTASQLTRRDLAIARKLIAGSAQSSASRSRQSGPNPAPTSAHARHNNAPALGRWSDTVNQLSYDRHVSWLIKPVEEIARELAGALRATVKECKLVTVRGAEPLISVSLSPIQATLFNFDNFIRFWRLYSRVTPKMNRPRHNLTIRTRLFGQELRWECGQTSKNLATPVRHFSSAFFSSAFIFYDAKKVRDNQSHKLRGDIQGIRVLHAAPRVLIFSRLTVDRI